MTAPLVGRTICRNCGRDVVRETAEIVSGQLGQLPAGTRLLIGFDMPIVRSGTLKICPDAPSWPTFAPGLPVSVM